MSLVPGVRDCCCTAIFLPHRDGCPERTEEEHVAEHWSAPHRWAEMLDRAEVRHPAVATNDEMK